MTDRRPPLCDYWLLSRGQCPREATVRAVDEYGAPLSFCQQHWALKYRPHLTAQYGKVRKADAA